MVTDDTAPADGGAAPVDGGAADADGEATAAGSYVVDEDAEFDKVEDAAFADLGEDFVCRPCDDVVQDETGEASQLHRELPAPKPPSKEEVRKHNLTHWPYRSWCPWCVMGRRNAEPHLAAKGAAERSLPLLVLDYAFLRNREDEDFATVLVGKCYPSRQVMATVIDAKGMDYFAVQQVADFIRECGLTRFVWKSDQEKAVRALVEEAVKRSGRSGDLVPTDGTTPVVAVPEASPVGSSASNGRAERTIQQVEDQLRTMKAALESRLGTKLPCNHPVVRWLVSHVADVINKSAINENGMTPYENLHGKKPRERRLEFGERVLYSVPKQGRAKMDVRWKVGVFLGHTSNTGEHHVGIRNGNVVRARSCVRVVEPVRWDKLAIKRVRGVPGCPKFTEDGEPTADDIERSDNPHDFAAEELDGNWRKSARPARSSKPEPPLESLDPKRVRITRNDLDKFGTTAGCPRCIQHDLGNFHSKLAHSEECRSRIYAEYKAAADAKWARAAEDLQRRISRGGDLHVPDRPQSQSGPDLDPNEVEPPPTKKPRRRHGDPEHDSDADDEGYEIPFFDVRDEPDSKRVRFTDETEEDIADLYAPSSDDEDVVSHLVNALSLAGVEPTIAAVKAKHIVNPDASTFLELYGRGSICREANEGRRDLNVRGLGALDLRTTKPDGSSWDFTKRSDRREARDMIRRLEPDFIIGSPPCTPYCSWNVHMNYRKMDPQRVRAMLEEGRCHLQFMAGIYRMQMQGGRYFVHEHPATALSWNERCILELMAFEDVHVVKADQCQFGLTTPGPDGQPMPALKPTKFLTNSLAMAKVLERTCDRTHKHQALVGGRCAEAAFYPLPLVRALIRGIAEQKAISKGLVTSVALVPASFLNALSADANSSTMVAPTSRCPKVDGGYLDIVFDSRNFKDTYKDEYTNEELPRELVRAAICEELAYFNDKVWRVTDLKTAESYPDAKIVRCRWVLCNKGDASHPDVRARLVACEVNYGGGKEDAFYASTPPLEAKKLLFKKYTDSPVVNGEPMRLGFVDAKKAYFNGIPKRNVFMRLPRELGLPSHMVGLQVRCVYGTRDAGAIWEDTYRSTLEAAGFKSGVSSPCIFHNDEKNVTCVVHGDDFTSLGSDAGLDWVEDILKKSFDIKVRGRIGVGCKGDNEIRILNRIVRITESGLEYEADPRHVDLIVSSLNLHESKPVATPGVKNPVPELEAEKSNDDDDQPKDLLDLLCALTSDSPLAKRKKSVTIDEESTMFHDVVPYGEIYGWIPHTKVATAHGWKLVSPRACRFTGKSSEVLKARIARRAEAHPQSAIDLYRSTMLRVANANDNEAKLVQPHKVRALLDSVAADPLYDFHDADAFVNDMVDDALTDAVFAVKKGKSTAKFKKRAGAKAVKAFEREVNEADRLPANDATTFRAISARGNYLAQDRPDHSYSSKELCREFAVPNGHSLMKLKRLGRYLKGRPRLVFKYPFATEPAKYVDVYCDTDFAGCSATRRSTSGGCALIGGSCVKHWSKTQTTIALSSGEAELSGIGAGMAQALGVQALAMDMGWVLQPRVYSDATAAIGISKRRGLGKIRHLHTCDLWVQEQTRSERVLLEKVLGTENPADIFTTYVDHAAMERALARMNCEFREGRAKSALDIAANELEDLDNKMATVMGPNARGEMATAPNTHDDGCSLSRCVGSLPDATSRA